MGLGEGPLGTWRLSCRVVGRGGSICFIIRNLRNTRGRREGGTTGNLALELSGTDGKGRGSSICVDIRNIKNIGGKKWGGTIGDLAPELSGISERRGINFVL